MTGLEMAGLKSRVHTFLVHTFLVHTFLVHTFLGGAIAPIVATFLRPRDTSVAQNTQAMP